MFGKKNKKEYKAASQGLERKKAIERLVSRQLTPADEGADLALEIMAGNPVAINLSDLDIASANKLLAFLSGVTFALKGETLMIKEKVYLFTVKENLEDGSLDALVR